MGSINEKLDYLNDTKQLIRSSLVQRGQTVDDSTPFRDYASKILNIDTQSDFIDNRTVINDFTYQNDGYYKDIPNPDDYKVNTTVLCIGNLYSAENVLEQTAFVIYQIMSVSDGNAHCKVVDILDEYNVGDIKLFETVEEMNADDTAKDGDLAIVYKSEIQNMTATTQTQYITFPETVTLPEAFTGSSSIRLRAVDESVMFDGNIRLNQTSFRFDGYSESGMIRVHYTSSDGVTYTRDEFMGDRGDLSNPVDLGTTVHCAMSEKWNDNFGYFMLIGGMNFGGLYKYGLKVSDFYAVPLSDLTLESDNKFSWNNSFKSEYRISSDTLSAFVNKCEQYVNDNDLPQIDGDYDRTFFYQNKLSTVLYISNKGYTKFNLSLCYDLGTNRFWIRLHTILSNIDESSVKLLQYNEEDDSLIVTALEINSSIKENNAFIDIIPETIVCYNNAPNGFYILTNEPESSDIDWIYTYYRDLGIDCKYHHNEYQIAPNQYNLTSSNQLLPDIIGYGKNGNVTGDGSIYDNTLTPTEYNESNSTLDEILEGYKPVDATQMNLFVQTTEPEIKNGIWVKTDTQYENKIAVQNALSETGEYTKLKNIPYDFSGGAVIIGTDIYLLDRNTNYKYDTLTDTYTQLTNIPVNFHYGSAVAVGTDIYLLGGENSVRYIYRYNTLLDTYLKLSNIPYSFSYGSAVAIGTDIYLLGGNISGSKNYKYDTLTDTYTQLTNIPISFNRGSAVAVGTDIYLLGGNTSSRNNYKYNTLTDTYTKLANIPYNFYQGSAVAVGTDIYLLGGNSSQNNNYKYNTLTDTYTQLTNISFSFSSGCAVLSGLNIYLLCGTYNYKFTLTLQNDIPNNSLVFEQGGMMYKTILFDSGFTNGIEYKFTNVWLKNADGTIDTTTPIYYGDGTKWIQFNGEVDN